jgi:hypothetical protein
MILTTRQTFDVMIAAGFPENVAIQMTAIAMRESHGDTEAFNGNRATGDRSYGLLQINMLCPQVQALLTRDIPAVAADEKALFDPAVNAHAGFLMWGGHANNLNIAWYINHGGLYQSRYEANLPAAIAASLETPAVAA